jgi:hypothetical protein
MSTIVGIIVGILVTIAVGHYYFKRSVNKRLSVYLVLSNRLFSGIDKKVRQSLRFSLSGKDVKDLHQVEFIVANDGDRAISNCIAPLTLVLPKESVLLDVSILHKSPNNLDVNPVVKEATPTSIAFNVPLLNKGDYFLVKLLVDGHVNTPEIPFSILCDDLPRSLTASWLPTAATDDSTKKVEWVGVIVGLVFLIFSASFLLIHYRLYCVWPSFSPIPWASFSPSWVWTPIIVLNCLGVLMLAIFGMILFFGMGFGEVFSRRPRFPLPAQLRRRRLRFIHEDIEGDHVELQRQLREVQQKELKQ